jgi:hypothetical protein
MNNSTVEIYWCPSFPTSEIDWNLLYYEPENLYDSIRPQKTDSNPGDNFFYCPAFSNFAKNTFLLKNPIRTHFKIIDGQIIPQENNYVTSYINRPPSMHNRTLLEYGLQWLFFSEEDIEITLTSPYFDVQPHMSYGCLIPGRFNISSWFRTVNLEFNLKDSVNEFVIEKDEILGYVSFSTDKKVVLKRFENNFKLESYAKSCATSSSWESWIPMKKRYDRFRQTRMKELVLKQIKDNLL